MDDKTGDYYDKIWKLNIGLMIFSSLIVIVSMLIIFRIYTKPLQSFKDYKKGKQNVNTEYTDTVLLPYIKRYRNNLLTLLFIIVIIVVISITLGSFMYYLIDYISRSYRKKNLSIKYCPI